MEIITNIVTVIACFGLLAVFIDDTLGL